MARQPGLESLCAESKDIPGLRLLHLELCHSPAPPPLYPSCSVCTATADPAGGQSESDRELQTIYFNMLAIEEDEFSQIYVDVLF